MAATQGGAEVSVADPYPGTMRPDSSTHDYCITSSMDTTWKRDVAHYAFDTLRNTTNMNTALRSSCVSSTDVRWISSNALPGTLRGQWECTLLGGSITCNGSKITLDFQQIDIGDHDIMDRFKTGVHELGHSVGFDHDTISAMRSGEIPDTQLKWRRYSTHDINHLNSYLEGIR